MTLSINEQISSLESYIIELDEEIIELNNLNKDSSHIIELQNAAYKTLKYAIDKAI